MKDKTRVFICSPWRGGLGLNPLIAKAMCRRAVDEGYVPIAPHLLYPQFLNDAHSLERKAGIECGLNLLSVCDEIWVARGERTEGMKVEIAHAIQWNIQDRDIALTEEEINAQRG